MGNMIEVSFLTDDWSNVKRHPKRIIQQIEDGGFHSGHGGGASFNGNALTVQPVHHMDDGRIYYAGQNSFVQLGEYGIDLWLRDNQPRRSDDDELLLDIAERRVDSAIAELKRSKRYLQTLREAKPEDRPGASAFTAQKGSDQHHLGWKIGS
jgi:hypothetical protein